MTTGTHTRASDADRQWIVEILQEQTAQGRLTIQEFQDRTDAAYRATTWQDLGVLTEDLPVQVSFDRDGDRTVSSPGVGEDGALVQAADRLDRARRPPRRGLFACCCGWTGTRSDA